MYEAMGATAPVTDATVAAIQIAKDPYLREVACNVTRLSNIEKYGNPGGPCARTSPTTSTSGVGLRDIVGPLRLYVSHRERPYVAPLLLVGGLGLVFAAGVVYGRMKR
jgi:hypothetical protein